MLKNTEHFQTIAYHFYHFNDSLFAYGSGPECFSKDIILEVMGCQIFILRPVVSCLEISCILKLITLKRKSGLNTNNLLTMEISLMFYPEM